MYEEDEDEDGMIFYLPLLMIFSYLSRLLMILPQWFPTMLALSKEAIGKLNAMRLFRCTRSSTFKRLR